MQKTCYGVVISNAVICHLSFGNQLLIIANIILVIIISHFMQHNNYELRTTHDKKTKYATMPQPMGTHQLSMACNNTKKKQQRNIERHNDTVANNVMMQ